MPISERKMKIAIENYFKNECDVNTSIREAFEKGFRIGVKQGQLVSARSQWTLVSNGLPKEEGLYIVTDSKGDVVRFVFEDTETSREYWKRCAKAWMPSPKPYEGDKK